jgi:hypothetical protein
MAAALPATARTRDAEPAATPPPATATGCEEHEAWVPGDAAAVAARLPKGYTAFTDPSGAPLVFARAERCDALTADGRTEPITLADWGVVIDTPDGMGCATGTSPEKGDVPPICAWYVLGLASDDERVVDWLRGITPSFPAAHDAGLTYQLGPADGAGGTPFHFASRDFTLDDVSSFRPAELSLRGGYWFDTPQGTVKLVVSTDDLTPGHAESVVHAPAGSQLAQLMGATERTTPPAYQEFGVIRIGHGVLRKQLLGTALPGEALDRFDGSCSVQGDVRFTPPATNSQAPTDYAYDAKGTCNGTLNGRRLSNVPVTLAQAGHADASCQHALAFPPSSGAVTFPGGTRLPYTLDFTSELTENDGTVYGTRSGWATMHSTFLTQRSSPTVVTDCAGTGTAKAPMDLSFTTRSPLVSSRPAPAAGQPAAAPGSSRRALRLTVTPRQARAGRRTRFSFRVTPAARATVWFAGRRVRTGPDGRATLAQRLAGRAGPRRARATRHGFRAATATIVVHR